MFIKRVYCHYTVHETFIMKSCLHVDLMHCIHIEFVDPPSKTVYNILINTVNSIHGQPLSSNHLYLKFAFSCPFTDIFIWNEPFTTGLTTYFTDWCLSIYTNLNKVITIQIWWTGYGIRHSRSRDQPWVTDETISRTTMVFWWKVVHVLKDNSVHFDFV